VRPFIKICGLTRPEDAELAAKLGATHVGCVVVPSSPRYVDVEQARRVFEAAGDGCRHVLVFKEESPEYIMSGARRAGTSHVQVFGLEEEDARELDAADLTVYRVHELSDDARELPILFPEPRDDRPAMLDVRGGGTGRAFSWTLLAPRAPHGIFIAGGVRPDNVSALMTFLPYGIDLSSGVESSPGIKDPEKLRLFFEELEKSL
jgi:indole-3-glycerol phosphate synthase/phosphoribosylanthranilate isomerase